MTIPPYLQGSWMETYLAEHTTAKVTHALSLCALPVCTLIFNRIKKQNWKRMT